ncbi:hypothetical protein [Streptomyces sp. TLI_171]|uniref:hypothetical protein n=1 Tax=Streptomyces sp. TLI_171 TaxID=1938859 RepID=UPI000C192743|nr:hypothetical protein [Streptomyces sp. TLI_171]RKE21325.1 hypothetical protein BX266_4710 [Streptomyces sp. TLI_171]
MKTTPPGYTVSIEDITAPATFLSLAHALGSLWETLRTLPLGWTQYEAYRYFFGPGATTRADAFLARDGQLTLGFALLGRTRLIRVTPTTTGPLHLAPTALRLLDTPDVAALRLDGPDDRSPAPYRPLRVA